MKKRILSLILALSMVLSVLPLGAFAADPPELVMKDGLPDTTNVQKTSFTDSDGKTKDKYTGSGWEYTKDPSDSTDTGILTLTRGEYDFSNTNPKTKTKTGSPTNQAVACTIKIESGAEITGGIFNATVDNGDWSRLGGTISNGTFYEKVINHGTISGGTFQNTGSVENNDTISDGSFNGKVTNEDTGKISGGTFSSTVENDNLISGGTFQETSGVRNEGTIKDGTFEGSVMNDGTNAIIENGTFNGEVQNSD